jgi:peptidyl-prolyl cis-trans isomerase C
MFKAILFLFCSFSAFAQKNVVSGPITITQDEFREAFQEALFTPTYKKISKDSVLDELINVKLAALKARNLKMDEDPEVRQLIEQVLNKALLAKDLEKVFNKIEVSEQEVKSYYNSNPEYRSSQILYRVAAMPSKKEVTDAYTFIATVYKELTKDSSKFEELAKKHSQIANNNLGGDIGFLPSTSMAPEYYEAIKGKPVGFISKPVRTQFGYHIIKVTGVKKYKEIDEKMYRKIIFDTKRDQIIENYYGVLKKEFKPKIDTKNY